MVVLFSKSPPKIDFNSRTNNTKALKYSLSHYIGNPKIVSLQGEKSVS